MASSRSTSFTFNGPTGDTRLVKLEAGTTLRGSTARAHILGDAKNSGHNVELTEVRASIVGLKKDGSSDGGDSWVDVNDDDTDILEPYSKVIAIVVKCKYCDKPDTATTSASVSVDVSGSPAKSEGVPHIEKSPSPPPAPSSTLKAHHHHSSNKKDVHAKSTPPSDDSTNKHFISVESPTDEGDSVKEHKTAAAPAAPAAAAPDDGTAAASPKAVAASDAHDGDGAKKGGKTQDGTAVAWHMWLCCGNCKFF
ncbi:hypothetical protein Pelo_14657 [Pelomyxa schiedti]|nr:hypothetical protein Pelo_14657 [Pelomyxa schiedti]